MSYCYLVQPVELVGTLRYKVGMSTVPNLSRMKAYKKGTRYLWICECEDALTLERKLIKAFNDRYKLIGGNEYFEVDSEMEMLKLFVDIVMKHKTDDCKRETAAVNWDRFSFRR